MAKLFMSAFADEYSSDFLVQLKALNEFGINYIEPRGVNGKNISVLTSDEVKTVKAQLDEHGIKASSIGSPLGKINIEGDLDGHFETAKRVFETANVLDCKCIRMFSFYFPENKTREEVKGAVYDALGKMIELAESHGVTLCHENEAKIYGENPEKCLEILNYFGGRLKCVFDMGNFVLDGNNPMEAYKMLYPYIEYFHIKDALYSGAIVPAGCGEAQIKEILDDYRKTSKKDTFISLEPHLQLFDGLNELVGKKFENPYKYENKQIAFADAVSKLKELL
jgi:sugar phosphate isomerase/epimerase